CAALLVVCIAELIRYVESGTRDLRNLLRAVAGGDFTSALPRRRRGASFVEYEEASRTLIHTYQSLDLRRAASDDLLRDVVEHVGAAVLCFNASGRIAFANAAARDLLGSPGAGIASLASTDPRLPAQLMSLQNDERAQIELQVAGERALLLLHARRFTLLDERFTVVFCHDIRDELESRDVEAWQTLTRVLTHEMMNSLTPIMTLSGLLRDTMGAQPTGTIIARTEDVAESIEVIHERSSGLARFIQAYRQFSNPPAPLPAEIPAAALLERVARLKKPELDQSGILLEVSADPGTVLHADAQQIEQVLINLLRNAQDALAGQADARIELRGSREFPGRVLIQVTDNGPGIAPAILDKVFVPFFTTRTGGTGIGLALSRQIVQLNGGKINVESQPGHCRFTLRLPGPE
ncbi:MAG TPA: ATP-binding protein, partial [Steroidobacteraceae bacterium]|nr:ATP-binding protein [Steroidobacteraceae bacterium]